MAKKTHMNIQKTWMNNHGSSLIEVLVAVTIVALVLTSVVATTVLVAKNHRISLTMQKATAFAQEPLEWIRTYRDYWGWQTFYEDMLAKNGGGATPFLCVSGDLPAVEDGMATTITAAAASNSCVDNGASPAFTRTIEIEALGDGYVRVVSEVSWQEGTKTFSSTAPFQIRRW